MKAQNTPGPWILTVVLQDADDPEKGGIYVHNNSATIAVCDATRRLPEVEQEANARLIAAAPDLLDEIAYLAELLNEGVSIHPDTEDMDGRTFLSRLEALIHKARGDEETPQ